jgi:Rps23 Pro-64 3,4-dihydroxylase Tpa1-like proline 4-hydroxylase
MEGKPAMVAAFQQVTLPVMQDGGLKMDASEARGLGQLLQQDFKSADPFEHIVLDEFLPDQILRSVLNDFPAQALSSDKVFDIGYAGHHKRQILPSDCTAPVREFFNFMNSQPVLQFLEGLTGIEGLLPDPYFVGGGFHEITKGGKLGIHADFRINEQLHVQRRINLLIYLNENWSDDWLGQLELWDRKMTRCVSRVSPVFNRCVVFQTDADTWHGHPDELQTPEGVARRSIALYYYTASRGVYHDVPSNSTVYVGRENEDAQAAREARALKFWESIREWVPPVLYRRLGRIRYRKSRH